MGQASSISDHPALRPRWSEPVIGMLLFLEALAFAFNGVAGHLLFDPGHAYGSFDRILWLILAALLAWMSFGFLGSNRRTRQLRTRLRPGEVE